MNWNKKVYKFTFCYKLNSHSNSYSISIYIRVLTIICMWSNCHILTKLWFEGKNFNSRLIDETIFMFYLIIELKLYQNFISQKIQNFGYKLTFLYLVKTFKVNFWCKVYFSIKISFKGLLLSIRTIQSHIMLRYNRTFYRIIQLNFHIKFCKQQGF